MKAGLFAIEVQFQELYFEVLYCAGRDAYVICVAVVIICDDCGGALMGLVGRVISPATNGESS